jgi:hypothetical protein
MPIQPGHQRGNPSSTASKKPGSARFVKTNIHFPPHVSNPQETTEDGYTEGDFIFMRPGDIEGVYGAY